MEPSVLLKGTIGEVRGSALNAAIHDSMAKQLHQKQKNDINLIQTDILPNDTLPFQRKQKRRLEM